MRPRTVFIGLIISLFAAGGVAASMYINYIRYEARALGHIPVDASLVIEINVEQAVVYQPFREHLLSLVEMGRDAMAEPGIKAIERLTTLELGVDAREVVYAEGPRGERWIVASGLFRKDGVVKGVAKFAKDQGLKAEIIADPARVAIAGHGFFSVTEDSSLIWSNRDASLLDALEVRTEALSSSEPSVVFRLRAPGLKPLLDLQVFRSAAYPVKIGGQAPGKAAFSGLTRGESALLPGGANLEATEFELGKDDFDSLMAWVGQRLRQTLVRSTKPLNEGVPAQQAGSILEE